MNKQQEMELKAILMKPVEDYKRNHPNATLDELTEIMIQTMNKVGKFLETNIRKKHQPTNEQM